MCLRDTVSVRVKHSWADIKCPCNLPRYRPRCALPKTWTQVNPPRTLQHVQQSACKRHSRSWVARLQALDPEDRLYNTSMTTQRALHCDHVFREEPLVLPIGFGTNNNISAVNSKRVKPLSHRTHSDTDCGISCDLSDQESNRCG